MTEKKEKAWCFEKRERGLLRTLSILGVKSDGNPGARRSKFDWDTASEIVVASEDSCSLFKPVKNRCIGGRRTSLVDHDPHSLTDY